eukprot:2160694-Pyramimonas_sp.AAC.1
MAASCPDPGRTHQWQPRATDDLHPSMRSLAKSRGQPGEEERASAASPLMNINRPPARAHRQPPH